MHEYTDRLPGSSVAVNAGLEQEFEARLVESARLAFRVAFSVLRHRHDAEEVAQEAFVKAYRRFSQLRDRDRFRAWLVRMTWRLALDRQRHDRDPERQRRGFDQPGLEFLLECGVHRGQGASQPVRVFVHRCISRRSRGKTPPATPGFSREQPLEIYVYNKPS